jgi:hypothetical protein
MKPEGKGQKSGLPAVGKKLPVLFQIPIWTNVGFLSTNELFNMTFLWPIKVKKACSDEIFPKR